MLFYLNCLGEETTSAATHKECESFWWEWRGGGKWDAWHAIIYSFSPSCGDSQSYLRLFFKEVHNADPNKPYSLLPTSWKHIQHSFRETYLWRCLHRIYSFLDTDIQEDNSNWQLHFLWMVSKWVQLRFRTGWLKLSIESLFSFSLRDQPYAPQLIGKCSIWLTWCMLEISSISVFKEQCALLSFLFFVSFFWYYSFLIVWVLQYSYYVCAFSFCRRKGHWSSSIWQAFRLYLQLSFLGVFLHQQWDILAPKSIF